MATEILNVFTDMDEKRLLRKVDFQHDDPWVLDTAQLEVGEIIFIRECIVQFLTRYSVSPLNPESRSS